MNLIFVKTILTMRTATSQENQPNPIVSNTSCDQSENTIPAGVFRVTLDAEWQEKIPDFLLPLLSKTALEFYKNYIANVYRYVLTAQALLEFSDNTSLVYVVVDSNLYDLIKDKLDDFVNVKFISAEQSLFVNEGVLDTIFEHIGLNPSLHKFELSQYWSVVDFRVGVGDEILDAYVDDGTLEQKRCLKNLEVIKTKRGFELVKQGIKDRAGWCPYGLKAYLGSVGIDTTTKSSLDNLKGTMIEAFISHPKTAMEYSIGDVTDLAQAETLFIENLNYVRSLAGLEPLAPNKVPATTGSIVASAFEEYLLNLHKQDPEKLNFALRKLGQLDIDKLSNQAKGAVKANTKLVLKEVNSKNWKSKSGLAFKKGYRGKNKPAKGEKTPVDKFLSAKFVYTAMNSSSVKYYADRLSTHTGGFNALVQGGRCNNENPFNYRLLTVADIDQKSCYGSKLRQFIYPLGLPTVLGYEQLEKRPTLGEFWAEYKDELIPGLFQIVVSTKELLSFRQDLIPSKSTLLNQIRKAYLNSFSDTEEDGQFVDDSIDKWYLKEDASNIPGEFGINKLEILNGIANWDVINAVFKVATDREKNELFNKLEVVTAAFYKLSDRFEDVDRWCDVVLDDRGELSVKNGDNRTRKWLAVPIEGFVGGLVDTREHYKQLVKSNPALKAKDEMLKLFVNTLYGVIASPYFNVGNTIVANNITAKARVGVWMLNKALHTVQSITDGGLYTPTKVPYLNSESSLFRRPGLATLADNNQWSNTTTDRRCGRLFKSLNDQDWSSIYQATSETSLKDLGELLDELALKHVNEFWGHYGLELEYQIEHKGKNCGTVAAYWNKGHYAIKPLYGKTIFKIRGAKDYKEQDKKKHPMYEKLTNILEGVNDYPNDMEYHHSHPIKIGQYRKIRKSADSSYQAYKGYKPGDIVVLTRQATFSDSHFGYDTVDQRSNAAKQRLYKTVAGKKVKILKFERFGDKGISGVHGEMVKSQRNKRSKIKES